MDATLREGTCLRCGVTAAAPDRTFWATRDKPSLSVDEMATGSNLPLYSLPLGLGLPAPGTFAACTGWSTLQSVDVKRA